MKKLISVLMVLVIVLGMVSGCGNEAASVEAEASRQSAAASVVEGSGAVPEIPAEDAESEVEETAYEAVDIRVAAIKGPTGIGMVKLMDDAAQGKTANNYEFSLIGEAAEVVTKTIAGEFDIACMPTNSASIIYQKTQGAVKLLALNTAGVLYLMQNTSEEPAITDWADLKGRTIYCLGQGANPEYVLDFVLSGHGIDPDQDVEIVFCTAADEIIAACASGECDICMLPEPAKTTMMAKVEGFEQIFDMTEGWDEVVTDGSMLTMGCVVVQTAFLEEHPEAVKKFLEEYEASVSFVESSPEEAVPMIVAHEIVPSEAVAKAALPGCHILFKSGQEMIDAVSGYYQVLFDADPTAVGGAVPDENFYYVAE